MKQLEVICSVSLLLILIPLFLIACGSDGANASTQATGELLEFSIDGKSFALDTDSELATNLGAFNFGGFGSVSATGLTLNGAGGTIEFSFGFEGAEAGTYTLIGNTQGTNQGLRLLLRSGFSIIGEYEAESISLKVTRFEITNGNADVEATFSGTLLDINTQKTANLTNGKIVILP